MCERDESSDMLCMGFWVASGIGCTAGCPFPAIISPALQMHRHYNVSSKYSRKVHEYYVLPYQVSGGYRKQVRIPQQLATSHGKLWSWSVQPARVGTAGWA